MNKLILAVSFVAICSQVATVEASNKRKPIAHKQATNHHHNTHHAVKVHESHKTKHSFTSHHAHNKHHARHVQYALRRRRETHYVHKPREGVSIASWYGNKFHGKPTSSGERYDMYAFTAAHRTLPLRSYARVTNLRNHRSVVVRINDRGGFHGKRAMDLSYAAAKEIGINGLAAVEITPLGFD